MTSFSYKPKVFLIRNLQNLHAGSGEQNYGAVDNLVQRDPVTGIPVIHSSSIKGALREFFVHHNFADEKISEIFGSSARDPNKKEGQYIFSDAELLFYPVRGNLFPYYHATCRDVLKKFRSLFEDYRIPHNNDEIFDEIDNLLNIESTDLHIPVILQNQDASSQPEAYIEDSRAEYEKCNIHYLHRLIGQNLALLNYADFFNITGYNALPAIARNNLENGESKNLWYEEIVPSNSVFYFMLLVPENNQYEHEFEKILTENKVQIGANATIGYGICKFIKINSF